MDEPLLSLSSCPCTTFHPCAPGQPASPWVQSAWYNTIPAGSEVGVGEGRFAEAVVACDGTVVEGIPVEQDTSEKSRSPASNIMLEAFLMTCEVPMHTIID